MYKHDEVKHASTLMALNTKLDLDLSGKSISEKVYQGMISSLLYLMTSRPDIMVVYAFVQDFNCY